MGKLTPLATQTGMVELDYLVCGVCHTKFPLPAIVNFLQHKKFDCDDVASIDPQTRLVCQSCPRQFGSPWGLLQHAQNVHALRIYLERGDFSSGITKVQVSAENPGKMNLLETATQATSMMQLITNQLQGIVTTRTTTTPSVVCANTQMKDMSAANVIKPVSEFVKLRERQTVPGQHHAVIQGSNKVTKVTVPLVGVLDSSKPGSKILVLQDPSAKKNTPVGQEAPGTQPLSLAQSLLPAFGPANNKIQSQEPCGVSSVFVPIPSVPISSVPIPSVPISSVPIPSVPIPSVPIPSVRMPKTSVKSDSVIVNPNAGHAVSSTEPLDKTMEIKSHSSLELQGTAFQQPGDLLSASSPSSETLVNQQGRNVPFTAPSSDNNNLQISTAFQQPGDLLGTSSPSSETLVNQQGRNVPFTAPSSDNNNLQISSQGLDKHQSEMGTQTLPSMETLHAVLVKPKSEGQSKSKECGENEKPCCGNKECECEEPCCDNLDCGITVMPRTHEKPKKCCHAVIPKKRKRHMETKHGPLDKSSKKCSHTQSFGPAGGTIFIDLEPSEEFLHDPLPTPGEDTALEGVGSSSGKPKKLSSPRRPPQQEHSVIIHPGSTLSIPVSYSRMHSNTGSSGRQSILTVSHSGLPRGPGKNSGMTISQSITGKSGKSNSPGLTAPSSGHGQVLPQQVMNISESSAVNASVKEEKLGNISDTVVSMGTSELSVFNPMVFPGSEQFLDPSSKTAEFADDKSRESGVLKKRRYPTSRPYKCDKCDQAFNQRIHLKKHQSKHTGEKPFKCNQCTYSTVEKSHLKVHIRVHTGEKPFKCTFCEYATAQNSTLKIHLKRHHNRSVSRGFSCATCGQHFTQPESLNNHTQQHRTTQEADVTDVDVADEQLVEHGEQQISEHTSLQIPEALLNTDPTTIEQSNATHDGVEHSITIPPVHDPSASTSIHDNV